MAAEFLENKLKLRCSCGIICLQLYGSITGKVPKHTEMPIMTLNGKSVIIFNMIFPREDIVTLYDSARKYGTYKTKKWGPRGFFNSPHSSNCVRMK